jgi:predicted Zn-dependent protease
MARGGGETALGFKTRWSGNLRWARNRFSTSGDLRNNTLTIDRTIHGAASAITLNQLDDRALQSALQYVEQSAPLYHRDKLEFDPEPAFQESEYLKPTLWYKTTYMVDGLTRAQTAKTTIDPAERAGMMSAGYLEVATSGVAVYRPAQAMDLYYPVTKAQYSVTVRDRTGTGSGWAGVNWNDWTRIDFAALSASALDKCLRSRNPQAVEPGRYTVILEPQAVYDFVKVMIDPVTLSWRHALGNQQNPYGIGSGLGTKIGQRLIDSRLSIRADPMDPDLGFVPFDQNGEPYRSAVWFDAGVLKALAYDRRFAVRQGLGDLGLLNSGAFRLAGSGPMVTIEEMVATTTRGLLVTRFWNVMVLDGPSLLSSGYTRDGLWLIERGKISKAIKNFRFTESPLFALNNVEQIGIPQRVFCPGSAAMVPPLKISDFNFSSLSDAI